MMYIYCAKIHIILKFSKFYIFYYVVFLLFYKNNVSLQCTNKEAYRNVDYIWMLCIISPILWLRLFAQQVLLLKLILSRLMIFGINETAFRLY